MIARYSSLAVGSDPGYSAIDWSVIAASATSRTIGPAVSCDASIGAMPYPGTRPTVGRNPTPACCVDGLMIEPDVSVPTVSEARAADAAAPEPDEEPLGPSAV